MNNSQILEFVSAFPPAHKATQTLMNIDYKKHLNQFIDAVVTMCAIIAVLYTLIAKHVAIWYNNGGKEMITEIAQKSYQWVHETAVPAVKNAAVKIYNVFVKVREIYELMNSPMFITA